jgi:hypothetical protein
METRRRQLVRHNTGKRGQSSEVRHPIETPKGVVFAVCLKRSEIANPALPTTMNIEKAHCLLGHQSEEATCKTANHLGWTLTRGTLQTCLPCTIGKARQKNTVKESNHETCQNPGERIFTDIASVRPAEGVKATKPHCVSKSTNTHN